MYINVHCSTIYKSQGMEATSVSINRRVDEDGVLHAQSVQLCPTLCDAIDHSPPGFSVHRIFGDLVTKQQHLFLLLLPVLLVSHPKMCYQNQCQEYFFMLSSRNFIVLGLTFKYLMYFALIFVYGIK